MKPEKDKLFIKIGQNFEANATGPVAILITFVVICLFMYLSVR
jgi:amino acid permease